MAGHSPGVIGLQCPRHEHPERLSLESTRPRLPGAITGLICPLPLESIPGCYRSQLLPATREHPGRYRSPVLRLLPATVKA